jgi:tetratricopeptide (TPR) repeat protein
MRGKESGPARFLAAATILANRGETAAAETLCRQLLDVFADEPQALHLLALLRRAAGDTDEALALLVRANAADPANPALAVDLAESLLAADATADARAALDRVDDPGPDAPEIRLRLAYRLIDTGATARAEAILRDAVARNPADTGPGLELAKLLGATERTAEAEALLAAWTADAEVPRPDYELALAAIEEARRRLPEARTRLEGVLAVVPGHADASRRLARLHTLTGALDDAVRVLSEAHAAHPDDRGIARDHCKSLQRLGLAGRALEMVGAYAERNPDQTWARIAMADTLVTLGDRERFVPLVEGVLGGTPSREDRLSCALVLARGRQRARAAAVVDAEPDDPDMPVGELSCLGQVLAELGRIEDGLAVFRRIIDRHPDNVSASGHLATWLAAAKRFDLAAEVLETCLRREPENANIAQNLAMIHLQMGSFRTGFRLYAAIYRKDPYRQKYDAYRPPQWDGTPRPGGRILVWADQGIGDQIIYSTFLEGLAARQPFDMEMDERLVPLYARSLPGVTVRRRKEIEADYAATEAYAAHLPLCLLPGFVLRTRADIPPPRPYLKADPERTATLRASLRAVTGERPLVGLSWRSVNTLIGRYKTTRLVDWVPVLRMPEVAFVALQYGDVTAEIREAAESLGVRVHEAAGIDRFADLDGLAALIAAMDAVVTTSNTNAHMAGALGVPTATVLSADPGLLWYWFGEDDRSSPWYADMTLIRQETPGEWGSAFERAAAWLAQRTGA